MKIFATAWKTNKQPKFKKVCIDTIYNKICVNPKYQNQSNSIPNVIKIR